jgi:hypothetical protein
VPRWTNLWEHTKHLLVGKPFAFERMQKVSPVFMFDIPTDLHSCSNC